ncbi:Ulp1 protease family, carboxy-terminal domain protein [Arachis hypogaea]|uniref:Ulp1 protease family, carboxy-terminal domain protein n=1 Tax=Arachis hypogaea TaxID=3818 RepID=A0A6B9VAE9_ARAHY|nr:Ulp1 protease family, carboxy-terminal domain protein [Arachis hypogaea]
MDIPSNEDIVGVSNDATNTQNMSLDCDFIKVDFGDQLGTTIPSAKDDQVINDDVIQSEDLNKVQELSSKVDKVLSNMELMKIVNMARDEIIDKIFESVSRIETMISQLSLNNDSVTPTKFSVQNRHPISRLKAKCSAIDIDTAISDDDDDLTVLDHTSFTYDDPFHIKLNMDKPVSPTIRSASKKKNMSKGKSIMGTQKKLPFTHPGGIRKPKIEPKSVNKSKASYALSQPTKDYRRPVYFFSITNSMQCQFKPTPTMRLLEDQIKACAYIFSASLDPSEELVVTDTIRATRSDFEHFIPGRPITDKIFELAALNCTDNQSDVSFKTTWQLPPRFAVDVFNKKDLKKKMEDYIYKFMQADLKFIYVPIQEDDHWYLMVISVCEHTIYHMDTHFNDDRIRHRERVMKTLAHVLEQVITSYFYKDDGIQEYNKQFHDYRIERPEDIPQCSSSLNSATWVMKWMDMTYEFKLYGNNKLDDHDIRMITAVHILRSRINHKKPQIIASVEEFWNMHSSYN